MTVLCEKKEPLIDSRRYVLNACVQKPKDHQEICSDKSSGANETGQHLKWVNRCKNVPELFFTLFFINKGEEKCNLVDKEKY